MLIIHFIKKYAVKFQMLTIIFKWRPRPYYAVTYEPLHDKTNTMAVQPAKTQISLGIHPPSLISVFAVRMKLPWVLSYPLSAQRRLWSDWVDAQADLNLFAWRTVISLGLSWGGSHEFVCSTNDPQQRCAQYLKSLLSHYLFHLIL